MSILEGELAATIAEALLDANVPFDVTVTRVTQGTVYDPVTGTYPSVTTHHAAKGFTETYSALYVAGGYILATDIKVVILLPTLDMSSVTPSMPKPGDTVTVRGQTLTVINASPDPALATIELQARG